MKIVVFFIVLLMIFTVKNSAISLLVYSFFAGDRDGYVFLEFFSSYNSYYKLITRIVFLIISLYSISYLFLKISIIKKMEFLKLSSILISSSLIVCVSLLKGDGLVWAFSMLVYSGLPAYFIWYVFSIKNDNSNHLIFYIIIKTITATIVLLTPSLLFLDGSLYQSMQGIFVLDTSVLNVSIPTGDSIKGAYSRYSIYHNPNSLGFHSVIALVFGSYLIYNSKYIYSKKNVMKYIGILLVLCGCLGWLNSLTRGPLIFYFLGLLYIFFINAFVGNVRNFLPKIIFIVSISTIIIFLFFALGVSEYLIPDDGDISVTGRVDGYLFSFNVIRDNFALGVNKDFDWQMNYPHFLPLALISDYGFVTGLLISLIFFVGNISTLISLSRSYQKKLESRGKAALGIIIIFIVTGIAITNNFTSPVIFWILLAQADLIRRNRV